MLLVDFEIRREFQAALYHYYAFRVPLFERLKSDFQHQKRVAKMHYLIIPSDRNIYHYKAQ